RDGVGGAEPGGRAVVPSARTALGRPMDLVRCYLRNRQAGLGVNSPIRAKSRQWLRKRLVTRVERVCVRLVSPREGLLDARNRLPFGWSRVGTMDEGSVSTPVLSMRTQVMRQAEPQPADPLGPLDFLRLLPHETATSSDQLRWVG